MTGWTIAMTGHRPKSLDNDYTYKSDTWEWIRSELTGLFERVQPSKVISGMALGVDTVAAEVAITLQIPLIAAIPFPGQEAKWSQEQKDHYNTLLGLAYDVEYVSVEEYNPYLLQKRNEWMVDRADLVVAVWNGFKGGTRNCIEYALKNQVPVWRIDPNTKKQGRYDGTKHIVKDMMNA